MLADDGALKYEGKREARDALASEMLNAHAGGSTFRGARANLRGTSVQ
jgi:hypothetical protein